MKKYIFITMAIICQTQYINAGFNMEKYESLQENEKARAGVIFPDLRQAIENPKQLNYLRQEDVVLLVIRLPDKTLKWTSPASGNVARTLDIMLEKAELKKVQIENGFFKIYDAPTAVLTYYGAEIIFRGRVMPKSTITNDINNRRAILNHELEAGDVIILDAIGNDP